MSEEAAPAAPAAAPAAPAPTGGDRQTTPNPSPTPQNTGGRAIGNGAPSAQEGGAAVQAAMDAQGVDSPGELDWSRTVTVTVDGQERRVPLSELRGNYELRRGSMARFEEAKRMRESAEAETKRLKEIAGALQDPAMAPHILRELGMKPEQLQAVRDAIAAELELPEDQRRARDLDRRQKELDERDRAYKQRLAREQAARDQKVFTDAFNSALDPHGLSGDKNAQRLMAVYLDHRYPRTAGARLTEAEIGQLATEAASYAAEQMEAQRRQAVAALDPAALAKLLTPEQAEALRAQRVEEYRQGKVPPPSSTKPTPPPMKKKRRINSLADFQAVLDGDE